MANLFDQFLATQGRMAQNDALAMDNKLTLAKIGQMERAQKMQDDTLAMYKAEAQPKVTLANMSEMRDVPDANLESQGKTAQEPATPPPKQKSVAEQIVSAAEEADRLSKKLQTVNPAEAEKQRRERDNLYLKAAPLLKEDRLAKIEESNAVNQWMGAIKDDVTLNTIMGQMAKQYPEMYKSWTDMKLPNGAAALPRNLDGSFAYTPQTQKIAEAVADASMKRREQLSAANELADNKQKELEFEQKKRMDAEKVSNDRAEIAIKREGNVIKDKGVEIKAAGIRAAQNRSDPFGIFTPSTAGFTGTISKDGTIDIPEAPALKTALGSNLHGEKFLELVPPALKTTVLQIAEGRGPMPPQGRNDPTNKAIRAMVTQYDPNYRESDYSSGMAAEKAFTSGRLGTTVRSFNVATQHLDTLQKAADALENGDIQAFNVAGNYIAKQTGKPAPTDFNATKRIVADEIVKSIVGGQNALADREDAAKSVDAANSPAQLAGVIKQYKELMAGQLVGLEKQYEASTKKTDFRERFLTAEAFKDVSRLAPQRRQGDSAIGGIAEQVKAAGGTYEPDKYQYKVENGKVFKKSK